MEWYTVDDIKHLPEAMWSEPVQLLLAWDDGTVESGWYNGSNFQHANGDMDYYDEAKVSHWMRMPDHPDSDDAQYYSMHDAVNFFQKKKARCVEKYAHRISKVGAETPSSKLSHEDEMNHYDWVIGMLQLNMEGM